MRAGCICCRPVSTSVCLSVWLSVTSLRSSKISRPIGSRKQRICVRQLYSFLTSEILAKFQLGHPSEGAPDTDCVGQNIGDLVPYRTISQKRGKMCAYNERL